MGKIRAYWECRDINNFGDIVGKYVIEKLTGKSVEWYNGTDLCHIYGGSLMYYCNSNHIIYGAGFGQRSDTIKAPPRKIITVRGPITREMLIKQGVDCPEVYGDMVYLLKHIYNPKVKKVSKYAYLPHYVDYEDTKELFSAPVIDICSGIENVVMRVKKYSHIYTSSLHGIILCETYGIPYTWIDSNNLAGDGMKFEDYFESIGKTNQKPAK